MQLLPPSIRKIVDTAEVTPITVGISADAVYRIDADAVYYLKIGANLRGEAERLRWLDGKLPVPKVIQYEVDAQMKHYLLTSEIEGKMMFEADLPVSRRIDLMAEVARLWHSVPIDDCPFDNSLRQQLAHARRQLDSGQIDARHFHSQFYSKSEQELYADLLNALPDENDEDLVITHGDLCLPNILVDEETGQITGFVDVGEMGISDRHLDLVLASRSIQYNLGSKWIDRFYSAYGIERDNQKYHFYCILNEFY